MPGLFYEVVFVCDSGEFTYHILEECFFEVLKYYLNKYDDVKYWYVRNLDYEKSSC